MFGKFVDDYVVNSDIKINVKGLIVGNPLISPPLQRIRTHDVAQSLGVVDEHNLEQINTLHKNCEEALGNSWDKSNTVCEQTMDYIQDIGGNLFSFDGRIFVEDYTPIKNVMDDFLGKSGKVADLYKALHID